MERLSSGPQWKSAFSPPFGGLKHSKSGKGVSEWLSIFTREKKIRHLSWILPILGLLIDFDKIGFQQTKHILCSFYSYQLKVGQLTKLLDNYPSI